jgi:hypothetical protein
MRRRTGGPRPVAGVTVSSGRVLWCNDDVVRDRDAVTVVLEKTAVVSILLLSSARHVPGTAASQCDE